MTDKGLEKYKKILIKHGHYCSDEKVLEIISNIKQLADVILNFEQNKNKQKNYANTRRNNQKS